MADIINVRLQADIADAERGIRTIKRDISSLGDAAKDLINPLTMIKTALASLSAWSGIQGVRSLIDTALAMERLNTQFRVLTDSAILGAAEFRFVTDEAKRLGQEITVLGAAYSRLIQATKHTKFEGAPTKAMFSGFTEAFTSLKMTSEQMAGVWLQINQGMMKGKIQLEDINIIGERGLNIMQLISLHTGKTTKELYDMVGKSKLLSDVYVTMGPMLSQIFGGAAKTAAQELQGTINNFQNEFFKLKAEIAGNFTPAFTNFLKTVTANMKEIIEAAKVLGTVLTAAFAGKALQTMATKAAVTIPGIGADAAAAKSAAASAAATLAQANATETLTAATLRSARATQLKAQVDVTAAQAALRHLTVLESSGAVMATDTGHMERRAQATVILTNAQAALTASETALTQAETAHAAASKVSAQATQLAAATTANAGIANRALAAATWAVEGATKAANAALSLVGGWIGVVVIALTTAVYWWNKYRNAKNEALKESQTKDPAIEALEEEIKLAQKRYYVATGNRKALGALDQQETDKEKQRMADRKKALEDEVNAYKSKNPIYGLNDEMKAKEATIAKLDKEIKMIGTLRDARNAYDEMVKKAEARQAATTPVAATPIDESWKSEANAIATAYDQLQKNVIKADTSLSDLQKHLKDLAFEEAATIQQYNDASTKARASLIAQGITVDAIAAKYKQLRKFAIQKDDNTRATERLAEQAKWAEEFKKEMAHANREVERLGRGESASAMEQFIRDMEMVEFSAKSALEKIEAMKGAREKLIGMRTEDILDETSYTSMSMVDDPYIQQQLRIEAAYKREFELIEEKKRRLTAAGEVQSAQFKALVDYQTKMGEKKDKYLTDSQIAGAREGWAGVLAEAKKVNPKLAALDSFLAVNQEKLTKYKKDGTKDEMKSNLAVIGAYVGAAGDMFKSLADTQDQASRSGFETAKALNMAATVMSTAAAIMNAMASIPYPMNIAAAVATAAMGAVQIAQIAKTKFGGGGGSVAAPSGSFAGAGGSASGNSFSNISKPLSSIQDSQTNESFDRLTSSTDNVAVAIGKLSKTMDEFKALFEEGGAGYSLATNAPGQNTSTKIYGTLAHSTITNMANTVTGAVKAWGDVMQNIVKFNFDNLGRSIKNALFQSVGGEMIWGGSWQTSGAGMSLAIDQGEVVGQDYVSKKKDPGLFQKTKHKTSYYDNPDLQGFVDGLISPFISDMTRMARTLGTRFNASEYTAERVNIATAGRKPEDIAKDLEAWTLKQLQGFAMTIDGLENVVGAYDDAYAKLKLYNDALVSTNDALGLIGKSQIQGSLKNGEWLANMQQSLFGGMKGFNDAVDTYFTSMFSDYEQKASKAAQATGQVNRVFAEMNRTVPSTKEEFRNLVNGLDLTTTYGAQTFAALMEISEAFATMIDQADEMKKAQTDLNQDVKERMLRVQGYAREADLYALAKQQQEELTEAREQGLNVTELLKVQTLEYADAVKKSADTVSDALKTVIDSSKKAMNELISNQQAALNAIKTIMTGPLSQLSPEAAYKQAQAAFNTADAKSLPQAATTMLEASKAYNASGSAYQADLKRALDALGNVGGIGSDPTLDAANAQIDKLEAIRILIEEGNAAQLAALETSMLGTNSIVAQLKINTDATDSMAAQLAKEKTAADDAKMQGWAASNLDEMTYMRGLNLKYNQSTAYNLDKLGGVNRADYDLMKQIAAGTLRWSSLGLPAFADGGIATGPSIVGEGGYNEAVIPLPDGRTVPVRMQGSADNKGIEERLDKAIAELTAMKQKLNNIEVKARLVANA